MVSVRWLGTIAGRSLVGLESITADLPGKENVLRFLLFVIDAALQDTPMEHVRSIINGISTAPMVEDIIFCEVPSPIFIE